MWYKKEGEYAYYHNGVVLYFREGALAGSGIDMLPGWLMQHGWTSLVVDNVPYTYKQWLKENVSW